MGPPLVTIHFNRIFQYKPSIWGIPHGTSHMYFSSLYLEGCGLSCPNQNQVFFKRGYALSSSGYSEKNTEYHVGLLIQNAINIPQYILNTLFNIGALH